MCCGPDSPHPSTFLIVVFRFRVSCSIFFVVFAFFLYFLFLRFFLLLPGNSSFFSVFVFFFVFLCFLFSAFSFFFRFSFCLDATSLFFEQPWVFAFFPFSKLRSAFSFSFCSPLYCNKGGLPGGLGPFRPRRTDGSAPCATTGAFLDNASFARFGPVGLIFFLIDAGSFLDSARRRSGVLVNFLHLPRSYLSGANAAATFPTLFSFRALAATLPRRYPRSPDMRDGLPLYIFAPRGTLEISEILLAPICSPLLRSLFRALAICCSGDMRRRSGRNFLSEEFAEPSLRRFASMPNYFFSNLLRYCVARFAGDRGSYPDGRLESTTLG